MGRGDDDRRLAIRDADLIEAAHQVPCRKHPNDGCFLMFVDENAVIQYRSQGRRERRLRRRPKDRVNQVKPVCHTSFNADNSHLVIQMI